MSDQTDTLPPATPFTSDETSDRETADDSTGPSLAFSGGLLSAPDLSGTGWAADSRREAWREFEGLKMPVRTDQAWRFSSLGKISLDCYSPPRAVSESTRERLIARSAGNERVAGRMIFANDALLDRRGLTAELASQGVIWKPLETAMEDHAELFARHFMARPSALGGRKFAALHRAHVRAGTFVFIPRNVEVALPLECFHWLSGAAGSCFPHTLIIAEAGAQVTLVDYFESDRVDEAGLACAVNDLIVGPRARVTYVCAQNWSERTTSFQINSTVVERDGSATSLHLNLGAAYARLESASRLVGNGARSEMLAATVADGVQEFDQRTYQDHLAPYTASDLLYKNALADTARTVFSGIIRVEPAAQHTDAYQKVRNLLLSNEAEANSMPGLEILADEVRCTHGATSGHIDAEELFYLLSRGIGMRAAQDLIVRGFLHEIFSRLPAADVTPRLAALLGEKFARMKRRQLTPAWTN